MALHMMKLSVGTEDIDSLARFQAARMAQAGLPYTWHQTRMTPRRRDELLDGGSIYWVIKGVVQVRQKLLDFEAIRDSDGVPRCRLHLDPVLVPVVPRPRRAFQGWRYLDPADAPRDLDTADEMNDIPAEMARELRELGLL